MAGLSYILSRYVSTFCFILLSLFIILRFSLYVQMPTVHAKQNEHANRAVAKGFSDDSPPIDMKLAISFRDNPIARSP